MTLAPIHTLDGAADLIEAFIAGDPRLGPWDWDDFICVRHRDPELESVRRRINQIAFDNPATQNGWFCSQQGFDLMRELAKQIRSGSGSSRQPET